MRSPQSQEAKQSDRQARTLRVGIVAGLAIVALVAAALVWWPDATAPAPEAVDRPPAAEPAPPELMESVGEALKDQGTIAGYTVVAAERALDLTLRAEAPEDAHAVAQATCDSLQGKIEPGWTVRVRPSDGGAVAADCSI